MAVMRTVRRRKAGPVAATAAVLALGLGLALPAMADQAPEGEIVNAGAAGAIDGSYIVSLQQDSVDAASAQGTELASTYGVEITATYKHAINGYAVEASEEQARKFAADPAVEMVAQNETVELHDTQLNPPSWGLDRIDQEDLPLDHSYTYPSHGGAGVTAYIVDTGINYSHEDFEGRARFGFDAFGGDGEDGNGHGTHVAGTTAGHQYGVAKNADLVAVRVLDDDGTGSLDKVVSGLDWLTANAEFPAVANMSLGASASPLLDYVVRNAVRSGITFAVAAGNDGEPADGTSPARVREAITVGATQSDDQRASYSNYGPALQIFAPGSAITSAWIGSDTATRTINGTSMATPHVSGAAALYLADHPSASPRKVAVALGAAAALGKVGDAGWGSPNKLLQVVPDGA